MTPLTPLLRTLLDQAEPVVLVQVAAAKGSTPREAGTAMLVTGLSTHGTIGGGRLEWEATRRAREMLASGAAASTLKLPLGPAVGQCCGGNVTLELRHVAAADVDALSAFEARLAERLPQVLLFGAGHVGRALARALAPLPLRLRWIDDREHEFPDPPLDGPEVVLTARWRAEVEAAPPGAAYFVMTYSHGLDFEICEAVLRRGDFAYLGLIGSRSKRARFEHGWRALGLDDALIQRLVCPIGGPLRDKRPPVIAALAAAQVLHALAAAVADGEASTKGEAAA
jgi:xanthine dehydrogenase accessory protein XdhC